MVLRLDAVRTSVIVRGIPTMEYAKEIHHALAILMSFRVMKQRILAVVPVVMLHLLTGMYLEDKGNHDCTK